jgi:ubiquinone biosynthesis protein UbiJ
MTLWLKPLEKAINLALKQDPYTQQKLTEFEGRRIVLVLPDLQTQWQITVIQQQVHISSAKDTEADLTLTGTVPALLKLSQQPEHLFSKEIKLHGDVAFAKQLQDLLDGFEFDWEQHFANITGDVIAQPLTYALKQGFAWLDNSRQSLAMTVSEYLREESQWLPHQIEVEDYLNAVSTLRADCDRLEARIQRLTTKKQLIEG